jgi:Lrp/AsnC family transcriptional regulator for asnA, asnC and gidA
VLGVTEGTVRARIRRMEEEGQIRITAITNIRKLVNPALAFIRVEVERGSYSRAVAEALARDPQIGFVAIMVGRFDILAITMVQSAEQLSAFLHSNVHAIEGVRRAECSLGRVS